MRVLFVSTGLNTGGAERMLVKLLPVLRGQGIEPVVVSLTGLGAQAGFLKSEGIPVFPLEMMSWRAVPGVMLSLAKMARRERFDVIQGWMYHGNLAAGWMRLFSPESTRLIFGVRHTLVRLRWERPLTRFVILMNALLSRFAAGVVYNSQLSRESHEKIGFQPDLGHCIPNGFNLDLFRKDDRARVAARKRIGLLDQPLIGMVGRFDPAKDHRTFLEAAKLVLTERPECRFLLVGRGMGVENTQLTAWIHELELARAIILHPETDELPGLYNAMDVFCLSSKMESFPNVLGEAMACERPCVSTDVGDAELILGGFGRVVHSQDAAALAKGIQELISLSPAERRILGVQARDRILKHFELRRIAR